MSWLKYSANEPLQKIAPMRQGTTLEQNQSQRALAESIRGGFFLRKKPLESIATGYSYSDFAIVVPQTRQSGFRLYRLRKTPVARLFGREGLAGAKARVFILWRLRPPSTSLRAGSKTEAVPCYKAPDGKSFSAACLAAAKLQMVENKSSRG